MSEREQAAALLNAVPEYKLSYVVGYLQGLVADEAADDAFCMKMYQDYQDDPDHGEFVSFEDALRECGVSPDEL